MQDFESGADAELVNLRFNQPLLDVFIPAVPLPDNEAACWVEIYCRLGLFPDDNDTIVGPIKFLKIL